MQALHERVEKECGSQELVCELKIDGLAIALAYHACEEGYKVSYTSMQSLMQVLRTQEIDSAVVQNSIAY